MNQTIARWAFIGGAGGTLGRALAKRYFSAGYNLLLHYNRNVQAVSDLCTELRSTAAHNEQEIRIWQADFADLSNLEAQFKAALTEIPQLDVLVNTAAVSEYALLIDMDWQQIIRSLNVNVAANLLLCKTALAKLKAAEAPAVVLISSIWGNYGACMETVYSASKGAINAFTKALAKEYAVFNIRVNAVAPGFFTSAMNQHLSAAESEDFVQEHSALMRAGDAEEIAAAVYFLASQDAAYITGEILEVSGLYL